jgi:bifunctional non-homologous end joining protein LigD
MARTEERKRSLATLLKRRHRGTAFNKHFEGDGAIIYKHACTLGCEGIVSKRLGSPYKAVLIIGSRSRTRPRRQ